MGAKAKIALVVLLVIVLIFVLWQFTSPTQLPVVGTEYVSQPVYTNRGSWIVLESMSYGKAYIAFSIANTSYPRTTLQTHYLLTISNVNETISNPLVKGFSLRVTSVNMQDNYDGSSSKWGVADNVTDSIQVAGVFNFQTSAVHELRFTITYQLYDLLPIGSIPDKTMTNSFNVTQNVV